MTLHPDIERVALLGWHLYPRAARHRAAVYSGANEHATCDLDQLARWSREYPACGWYCITGPSGIWGLDVDCRGEVDGAAALLRLGKLPPRPTVQTGGGGWLLVFRDAGHPLRGQSGIPAPGLDPRRGKQTITIPPTRHHATGKPYTWRVAPWDLNPPVAPAWLLQALRPPPERPLPHPAELPPEKVQSLVWRALDHLQAAQPGSRNDTLNRVAYRIGRLGLSERNATDLLMLAADRIGLPRPEARATIRSALRSAARAA